MGEPGRAGVAWGGGTAPAWGGGYARCRRLVAGGRWGARSCCRRPGRLRAAAAAGVVSSPCRARPCSRPGGSARRQPGQSPSAPAGAACAGSGGPSRAGSGRCPGWRRRPWGRGRWTLDAQGAQLVGLVGVVGEQVQLVDAEGAEHLGGRRVVAGVLRAGRARRSRRRCRGPGPGGRTRRACCRGRCPGPPGAGTAARRRARRCARRPRAAAGRSRSGPSRRRRRSGTRSADGPAGCVPGAGSPRTTATCSWPSVRPWKVTSSVSTP